MSEELNDELFNMMLSLEESMTNNSKSQETRKEDKALMAVLEAMGEAKEKEEKYLKDNFSYVSDYLDQAKKDLEEILEDYFPNRWEIKQLAPLSPDNLKRIKEVVNKLNFKDINNQEEVISTIIRCRDYTSLHPLGKIEVLIHFPEITITNRSRGRHVIRDLWMRYHFNWIFRMLQMGGIRSSKTWAEYSSNYNHSHMNCTQDCDHNTFLRCCLGSTDYADMNTQMTSQFNKNIAALYFQQLTDYLSWESLEGGPFIRIEEIGNRQYNTARGVYINQTHCNVTYKEFLKKFPKGYNIELVDNGAFYNFNVVKDEAFKQKVTEVCPEEIKMLYDTVQKRQYIENGPINSSRVQQMNDTYKRSNKLFDFKGNPVYFQIVDPSITREGETNANIVKVAPESIVDYVHNKLQTGINKYYVEEFTKNLSTNK